MTIGLTYADAFFKGLKGLPPHRQEGTLRALELFVENQALHRFKFRALQSRPNHFIINAAGGDRIILKRTDATTFEAVDVGTHDIYRKWNR